SAAIRRLLLKFGSIEAGLRILIGISTTYVLGNAYKQEVNAVNMLINSQISRLEDLDIPGLFDPQYALRPDIQDKTLRTLHAISTPLGRAEGVAAMTAYLAGFLRYDHAVPYTPGTWSPGNNPYSVIDLPGIKFLPPIIKIHARNSGYGIITYTVDGWRVEAIALVLEIALNVEDFVPVVSAAYSIGIQAYGAIVGLTSEVGGVAI